MGLNKVLTKIFSDLIPDIVKSVFMAIFVVAILALIIWAIGAKCREIYLRQKVATPENKGLLQSRKVGYWHKTQFEFLIFIELRSFHTPHPRTPTHTHPHPPTPTHTPPTPHPHLTHTHTQLTTTTQTSADHAPTFWPIVLADWSSIIVLHLLIE